MAKMEPNPFKSEDALPEATDPTRPRTDPDNAAVRKTRDAPVGSQGSKKSARRSRWLAAIVAVVFLTGFTPMSITVWRHADERDAARREVRLLHLEIVAASASIDARRGKYELARQAASWFFAALSAELKSGSDSSLTRAQQDTLRPLLTHRDGLITLLARGDPASVGRLTDIYLVSRAALRGG